MSIFKVEYADDGNVITEFVDAASEREAISIWLSYLARYDLPIPAQYTVEKKMQCYLFEYITPDARAQGQYEPIQVIIDANDLELATKTFMRDFDDAKESRPEHYRVFLEVKKAYHE